MSSPTPSLSTPRRRAVIAFCSIAAGLILARFQPSISSTLWFSAACAFLAVAALGRGWTLRIALMLAAAALAGGWFTARIHERDIASIESALTPGHPDIVTIDATLLDDPSPVPRAGGLLSSFIMHEAKTRFTVEVDALHEPGGPQHATGSLWVRVKGKEPAIRAGDRIRITGIISPVEKPLNPGTGDLRLYAAQTGFAGSLAVSSIELITPLPASPSLLDRAESAFLRFRADLRARATTVVDRAIGNEDRDARALVTSLLLGGTDDTHELRTTFARLGLAHALSISGFHLAVMAFVSLALIRLTGDRGWVEPALVAILVILYTLIVPPSSPILRSSAMVLAWLTAEALGRRYDRLTLLIWISIGLLIWRPYDLWNLGYQLTVGLTALLFWLGESTHQAFYGIAVKGTIRPTELGPGQRIFEHIKTLFSSSVMCCGVSAPLLMFRVGMFSPIALIATILITPILVGVLWVGYIALILGMLFPPAADVCGLILRTLARSAIVATDFLDSIPFAALRPPQVSLAWTIIASAALLALFRRPRLRDSRVWVIAAALILWLGVEWFSHGLSRDTALRIDTISVGDGSCHAIRSGHEAMLWDCGSLSGLGDTEIPRALRAMGVWRTPTVVITHPDIDHFGALPDLIAPLGIRTVITCQMFITQAYEQPHGAPATLLRELTKRGIAIHIAQAGETTTLGDCTITFLSPPFDADWPKDNDHSLVARFDTPTGGPGAELLMTGDIQQESIARLTATYPDLKATALELPHHGSALPTSIAWVRGLNPQVILQSTSPSRLNDPRWATVRNGRTWYTTCADGAAWVEITTNNTIRSGSFQR